MKTAIVSTDAATSSSCDCNERYGDRTRSLYMTDATVRVDPGPFVLGDTRDVNTPLLGVGAAVYHKTKGQKYKRHHRYHYLLSSSAPSDCLFLCALQICIYITLHFAHEM